MAVRKKPLPDVFLVSRLLAGLDIWEAVMAFGRSRHVVTGSAFISLQIVLFPLHPVTSTSPWYPHCYVC